MTDERSKHGEPADGLSEAERARHPGLEERPDAKGGGAKREGETVDPDAKDQEDAGEQALGPARDRHERDDPPGAIRVEDLTAENDGGAD